MKRKALLAGFMAVSLALSSAVVPTGVNSVLGNVTGSSRMVVYAAEPTRIEVEGMDSESINLNDENFGLGDGEGINLPVFGGKIEIEEKLEEDVIYTLSLPYINTKYTDAKYEFVVSEQNKPTSAFFEFKKVNGKLIQWSKDKNNGAGGLTSNEFTKITVRRNPYKLELVPLNEFEVVYENGSPVEDGILISIMPNQGVDLNGVTPKGKKIAVSNGKIVPELDIISNTYCEIGFAQNTANSKLVRVKESNVSDITTVHIFVDEDKNAWIMKKPLDYDTKSDKFERITLIKKSDKPLYTGPVVSDSEKPKEGETKDIEDEKTALGEASGSAVKGKKIKAGNDVKVADIEVVFEDGTKAPDGLVIDNFRMKDIFAEPTHYKVKDGKISGIVMKADEQYKIGFDVKNADYNNYEVVGAYKSKKLLRVYARYEGGVLLKYDYDEGIEAPEEAISKIVIKKTDGKPSEQVKAISCLINLLLSDSGYQPEGKLPFRLIRKDNNKSKLIYSGDDGVLTLIGEGDVSYELKLEKNPVYKLKNKIEFSFAADSNGTYQPVIKGYKDANNLEERLTSHYIELVRLDGKTPKGAPLDSGENTASKKYKLKDYKIIYNTKKVAVNELSVKVKSAALKKDIKFEIYNATKQKVEKTLTSKNGKLSGLKLVQGNDYIISAIDKEYSMKNAYVTISSDGKKLLKSKAPYGEFKGFELKKRAKALKDEKQANRVAYKLPVYLLGNNKEKIKNTRLRFISTRETIEADVVDDWVDLSLLEDTNYVAEVIKGNYAIDAFPMTVKDKSEYGAKKYVFNHLSCGSVQALYLIDKKMAHKNDTTLLSGDGTTSATGFRFGNGEYTLSARVLKDVKVPELKGKKYMVLDVDTVNMYRVELSPLAYGQFKITTTLAGKKAVKNVYYIDDNNKLQNVKFTQKGDKLTFEMNSMALYNNVIEYK